MDMNNKLSENNDDLSINHGLEQIQVKLDKFISFQALVEHKTFELFLILSGEGEFEINGVPYKVSSGSLCFLSPFHLSKVSVKGKQPIKYMSCKFTWSYISQNFCYPIPQIQNINYLLTMKPYLQCRPEEFSRMLTAFERLCSEYQHWHEDVDSYYIKTQVMYLCHLYAEFLRKHNFQSEKASLLIK